MNDDVNREIVNAFKIQPGSNEQLPKPVAVVEVGTKLVKNGLIADATATNATSATLITTPTDQDLYVIGAQLGVIKDATSQSTNTRISIIQNGVSRALVRIPSISLTAQSEVVNISFNHPIKVDRGTNIAVLNSSNVANITASASIIYFLDEVK